MNPVIQPKQTTPVFVVALLLDGFAIAQSAYAIDREPGHPPNHRVFRVSVNTFVPPPCAGENVQLSGELHLHFMTINGVAKPQSAELRGVTVLAKVRVLRMWQIRTRLSQRLGWRRSAMS